MRNLKLSMPSEKNLPFLLLLMAGVMEFLYMSLEGLFSYIGYYLVEDYIIIPTLLFVGIALTGKRTVFGKRRLLLSAAAVAWFVVVQFIHRLTEMDSHPIGTVLFVYLMAFPFAAVTDDRENRGIDLVGWILIGASMMQVFYAALLVFDCVPAAMTQFVYWDGARLHTFWHSNITACFLMVGIGFTAAVMFRKKNRVKQLILLIMILMQFVAMALTNCRTTLLMTGAFFGSMVFFHIWNRNGWKRFMVGILAVTLLTVVCFKTAGKIFEVHNDLLIRKITAQVQQNANTGAAMDSQAPQTYVVNAETGEVTLDSNNDQGTLSHDMKTLNGRTWIWQGAVTEVRDNWKLALWGTEYVGLVLTPHMWFSVVHAHNSWMEMLLRMGLPGLLISLVFTGISGYSAWVLVWSERVPVWKKVLAVMTVCVMGAGFLEPYLFITNVYYHVTDFIFFFCTGYLDFWRRQLKEETK